MSDSYQILAFDTVASDDAQKTVGAALDWMRVSGFVQAKLEDCTYGDGGLGHRPGPNWMRAVDGIRSWGDLWCSWSRITRSIYGRPDYPGAPSDTDPYDISDFLRLAINGVQASTGNVVCEPGEYCNDFRAGVCPACGKEVDIDIWELMEPWVKNQQPSIQCHLCSKTSRLEDWDCQPYFAFAHAELTFWNWPPISEQFKAELLRALSLPRLRHILGHL